MKTLIPSSTWKWTLAVIAVASMYTLSLPIANAQRERYQEGQFWVERFGREDGLPQEVITAIKQSRKGFLWITTAHYLVRYDGYTFESWSPDVAVDYHFSWDGLLEDSKGNLWIGDIRPNSGLFHFDTRTEKFTHFHADGVGGLAITSNKHVNDMIEDRHGAIWVATAYGLNRITYDSTANVGFLVKQFLPIHYDQAILDRADAILTTSTPLAAIDSVTNLQRQTQQFDLADNTWVLIHVVGEIDSYTRADWGWLESETGDKIWEMTLPNTIHAGGDRSNRLGIEVKRLPPGRYALYYQTDDSHDYSRWYREPPEDQSLWGARVTALKDQEGRLLYDYITQARTKIPVLSEAYDQMHEDQKGDIWLSFGAGMHIIKAESSHKDHLEISATPNIMFENNGSIIQEEEDGLWFLERRTSDRDSSIGHFITKMDKNNHHISASYPILGLDRLGWSGIWRFRTKSFANFISIGGTGWLNADSQDKYRLYWVVNKGDHFQAVPFSFKTNGRTTTASIWATALDNQNHLWVGVRELGLYKITTKPDPIYFFPFSGPKIDDELAFYSVFEDKNRQIWLHSNQGIWHFDRNTNTYKLKTKLNVNSQEVPYIFPDQEKQVWGRTKRQLLKYDDASASFKTVIKSKDDLPSARSFDNQNNLWAAATLKQDSISSNQYLLDLPTAFFQFEDGKFISFPRDSIPPQNYVPYSRSFFVADGRLWHWIRFQGMIGYSIDEANKRLNFLGEFVQHPDGIDIYEIFKASPETYWLGTWDHGLIRFNPNTGEYKAYTRDDGLPSNFVINIEQDGQGRLWVFTDIELCLFDPGEEKFFTIHGLKQIYEKSAKANLYGQFGNSRKITKTQAGEFMVLGNKGFFRFHPDSIRAEPIPPVMQITHFIMGKANKINVVNQEEIYRFKYHQNDLTIHYVGVHFDHSSELQYQYKMEGLHEDWVDVGQERVARFSDLDPGRYSFWARTANADGLISTPSSPLRITILPPWWKTWWAYTLYGLLVLGVIWFIRRIELAKQEKKLQVEQEKVARERKVNAQLKRIDQLKNQFLANTSHELRTPLQGIIGLSEAMLDRSENFQDQEDLSMVVSSGKRLNSLVNDILDFSKLKNYDIKLMRKPVNLRVLADIVLKNNVPLVKGKDLELINTISADLKAVNGDENRLQQVLYNLIGNAIKFTEEGHIKLNAQEKEGMIQVSVEDTGIGIPVNKQAAIFQEFEQGDGSISREFTGTGLGLSISKRLVELHGGQMWVKSEVGEGAAFFFTLPVSKEKATTLTVGLGTVSPKFEDQGIELLGESAPVGVGRTGEDIIRILVVDDEPINQQVLKNHLSSQGFQLTQAMNGDEAIKAIQNHPNGYRGPFDLVLLDVMMPRMSGYEVCQKIREKHLPSELPIIMVTAKNQLQDVVQGLSLGANDYLPKPFHKEELLARINTQLDLHRIFKVASRFVPNEFLHSLNRERITQVVLGDYIEQEVTVLFTDIRDYTGLAETMTPEQNFKFVNAFNGRMGPIIQKHQGFVNQYLGDAIMAIFPGNPANALSAAIEMQKRLAKYNQERTAGGRQTIKMGIGLHTGSLIMGIIGDKNRMDAATIADTVNTASRIESLTKYYGTSILLSEDSVRQIENSANFHFRHLGKVKVKGKKKPVGLYECYDGDAAEIAAQKANTQPNFEKGLEQFFNREFPDAVTTFNSVLKTNAYDQPAQLFMNKSSEYLLRGVPDDWTGVEVMTFK